MTAKIRPKNIRPSIREIKEFNSILSKINHRIPGTYMALTISMLERNGYSASKNKIYSVRNGRVVDFTILQALCDVVKEYEEDNLTASQELAEELGLSK